MNFLETFSTDYVEPHRRLDYWNAAIRHAAVRAHDPMTFSATWRRTWFRDLQVQEMASDAATIIKTRAHVAQADANPFVFHVQLAGEHFSESGDRRVHLRPGDFTLKDSSRPFKTVTPTRSAGLSIVIERSLLERRFAALNDILMMPMSGRSDTAAITVRCLRECWNGVNAASSADSAARYANIMLDVIACAYADVAMVSPHSTSAAALRIRVLDHIEQHMADPNLTPQSIADHFKVSVRYLHQVFAEREETVGRHVLHRRLERTRAALEDRLLQRRSILSIAHENGFVTAQHFCKVFRARFGMTAGECRRAALVRQDNSLWHGAPVQGAEGTKARWAQEPRR